MKKRFNKIAVFALTLATVSAMLFGIQTNASAQGLCTLTCPTIPWTCPGMGSPALLTLPCGAQVMVDYCTRNANCNGPAVYEVEIEDFKVVPGTDLNCSAQQLVDQTTIALLLTNPMNNPVPPNGFCYNNWNISKTACWYVNATLGEYQDTIQILYGACYGNACCQSMYTICNNNGTLTYQCQWVQATQQNCQGTMVPPDGGVGCWFDCND